MCVTSLALYGGYSFSEGELSPESVTDGKGGRLDWGFFVGVGGASAAVLAAILFFIDGCRLARIYRSYQPPTVVVS